MNFFTWLKQSRERSKSLRFADDLAFHMHSVYTYLLRTNANQHPGGCIKEAIGMLEQWHKASENLFAFQPSGAMLEVKPESKLAAMTLKVLEIELAERLKELPEAARLAIINEAKLAVENYFALHQVHEHSWSI